MVVVSAVAGPGTMAAISETVAVWVAETLEES